jgi:septum site-determining protein MinD
MARVIGVFSGKGGVGKTTTTVNIGAAFSYDFGKNVTVIDTNTSSSCLSLHLGMHYAPLTINNVLRNEVKYDDAIEKHGSGMRVMPASIRLQDSFVDLSALPNIIKEASKDSDIVLLDTAPSIGDETLWSLKACNEAIIVTNPDLPSVVEALKMIKLANEYNVKVLGLVVNKMRKKHALSLDEISKICNIDIIATIPFDTRVDYSIEKNIPVVHLKPYSKSGQAFKKLASDLLGVTVEAGLWSKFRSKVGV